jgi:glutamate synthase (NADPH/NADH) small chain
MENQPGFLRYPRKEAGKQFAKERIRHWREYEQVMPDGQVVCQAARCMDCGTPYCHGYCPVHNLIPDWNALVSDGNWREAYEHLDSTNNFPEFTGRICAAPCEPACTLTIGSRAVTIRCVELAIVEHAWAVGWVRPRRSRRRLFRRVAIIGSGPAALACAQQLVRVGYRVTVYEKADRIGGLLRYGIPDFRLDKAVLDRRLAQLEAEGVVFHTGAHAGVNLDIETLRRRSHALVLACGSEQPRDLPVEGRALEGVHFAMDYLRQQNRRVAGDGITRGEAIDARGKRVVVIGGGDTGGDCVGTAIRQGAREVSQIQYHDRPAEHVDIRQYWPDAAPLRCPSDHEEEGCDYLWGWDTTAFEGRGGRVTGVRLRRLQWMRGDDGAWTRRHCTGQVRRVPTQLILLALGYVHPVHEGLVRQLGLELDARRNVLASDEDYQTSVPGVFACGDMRRGQSLVVWAIREGRQCAHSVDRWLSGNSVLPRI